MLTVVPAFLRSHGWTRWHVSQSRRGTGLVWLVFGRGQKYPAYVAKMSRTPLFAALLAQEADALRTVEPAADALCVPRLCLKHDAGDAVLTLQTGVPGRVLPDAVPVESSGELTRLFQMTVPWLQELHRRLPQPADQPHWATQVVVRPRQVLRKPTVEERVLLESAEHWARSLVGLRGVAVHGDFWTGNVLADAGNIAIIDWAIFHFGSPMEDVLNLIAAIAFRRCATWTQSGATMWPAFFRDTSLCRLGGQVVRRAMTRHGIDDEQLRGLFGLFLLSRLGQPQFTNHRAWRAFVVRYVRSGMPAPFTCLRS